MNMKKSVSGAGLRYQNALEVMENKQRLEICIDLCREAEFVALGLVLLMLLFQPCHLSPSDA